MKDSRLLRCDIALFDTWSLLQSFKIQGTKSAPYQISKIPCCLCKLPTTHQQLKVTTNNKERVRKAMRLEAPMSEQRPHHGE
jgi:hypothetical protein